MRGLAQGSTATEIDIDGGNGAALLEELYLKQNGISDESGFSLKELKMVFRTCFSEGNSN